MNLRLISIQWWMIRVMPNLLAAENCHPHTDLKLKDKKGLYLETFVILSGVPPSYIFHARLHTISHCQNGRESGSESIPQWCMGLFGGTGFERGQAKRPRQYNCCAPGSTNRYTCSGLAMLLGILFLSCPSKQSHARCLIALLIPTQFPTRFSKMANSKIIRSLEKLW